MEVSIANAQTKPRSLFAMLRNKNASLIVTPKINGINRFVILSSVFATLISGHADFCKTYFCFQGAVLEVTIAKTCASGA